MILRRGEDFHQLIFFLVSLGFQFLHGDLPNSETPSCKLQCIFLICLFLNLFTGPGDKHEFQAETRKLLDIVAKSLYSEKEVCHQNNILLFQSNPCHPVVTLPYKENKNRCPFCNCYLLCGPFYYRLRSREIICLVASVCPSVCPGSPARILKKYHASFGMNLINNGASSFKKQKHEY